MFTIRFNCYQILQFILIFCVSSMLTVGQAPKKCAAFNEYCQNHWDCCSNSCMSYIYRCSRGYNSYPYPFLGVSYKPSVTLDQILEQNFGSSNSIPVYQTKQPVFASRFGGANDAAAATEVQIVLQQSSETVGETTTLRNQIFWQEATTVLPNHLQKEENSSKKESELLITKATTKNANDLQEKESGTQKHIELLTTPTTTKRTTDKISCAEIAEKCYRHKDCCSKLCHGYLHKCVT